MQSRTIKVTCECHSVPSVDQLLTHLEKQTGLTPDLFRSSNVQQSVGSAACPACNGTGYVLVPNGPEDIDKEPCAECNGTGQVVAANF